MAEHDEQRDLLGGVEHLASSLLALLLPLERETRRIGA